MAISFVIPILGALGVWLVIKLSDRKGKEKRYIHHERFYVNNFNEIGLLSLKRRESIPFFAGVQTVDDIGKDLVVRLMENKIPEQGRYLKAAVVQQNRETAHYAATALNLLNKRYETIIHKMLSETSSLQGYKNILYVYKEYLTSDIVSDTLLKEKKDVYENLLREAIKHYPRETLFYEQLALYYWENSKKNQAVSLSEKVISDFPNSTECYFILLNNYYVTHEKIKLNTVLTKIENHYSAKIPVRLQSVVDLIKG
ncbi:tetratricopeptide repeat protein [Fictibacillus halophilus]|uniref:tetratricopeptide repeat protein n=1 Tax=Fictibacillus halophilus TaxID=1610490 RepID=UPI0033965E99